MSDESICLMCERRILAHSKQELRVCLHDVQIMLRKNK